ncbi:MAG: peptidoglycan DD-metalloendopeptidase family protein [Candidatus Marinimicrobia bacterium]|jgi:murein DD-endopeptidase MepM/ murein hydrolase activator NlpD|nr:peptidoglycan DD-metalloendopeptidase family protein [Candidatus Neomarinimicrobiota bacterium]MBT3937157.1 peptidoglycan DD-metalloendopeptidase family protein [Candidatus Neomarinimicrobiota bacterium]MBT3960891.1 peptidoglycan DD-metalloendopeptidase family protein [Candidatus Neomarinimicrobiota bacterium]MBT4383521.1 peptidoglycan DD-metalloendopeptidase family protein [Candidatus Neomarinimicrobiota bacterium]MBT4636883.1 peptidoglycan DD-metalloendopeptidase family protein [Candidatus
MKQIFPTSRYIIHRETEKGVSQVHFSRVQFIAILSTVIVLLGAVLFFSADSLSKLLYQKRLAEFKQNYHSVSQNLDALKTRLDFLDSQILALEEKDQAVRTYAGMPDIDKEIRQLGIGGIMSEKSLSMDNLAPAVNKELTALEFDIDKLSRKVNLELISYENIYDQVKTDVDRIRAIPSIRPIDGGYLNSSYGYRDDPIDHKKRFHQGQDITVRTGTPIHAPADGKIRRAYYVGGFGNHIKIDHGYGYTTIYAHLSKLKVRTGQKVKRGDIIGYTGNTGRSTAPHLHYEVHYYGSPQNPLDYFFSDASR